MEKSDKIKLICDAVRSYPDFPKPRIFCFDVDFVVGLDLRAFLLDPRISFELAKPFVSIRKKGKLPGKVNQQRYALEYGEMQADSVDENNNKASIVDDLLATGGTISTAEKLLKSVGVPVVEYLVTIELKYLNGRSKIEVPVHSLFQYD